MLRYQLRQNWPQRTPLTLTLPHLSLTPYKDLLTIPLAEANTRRDLVAIILTLSRPHATNFARDTISRTRRYIEPSTLPRIILIERRRVILQHYREIMPESWCEFRCRVSERRSDEGAVCGLCGVVFGPDWGGGLVACDGHFGGVGCHVENAEGDGVDGEDVEGGVAGCGGHGGADVGYLDGVGVGLRAVVAVGDFELVDVCVTCLR